MAVSVTYDSCSCANFSQCSIVHMDLNWKVDFDRNIIGGSVELNVKFVKDTSLIALDTRDLSIESVQCDGSKLEFTLKPFEFEPFGSKLLINFPSPITAGSIKIVLIKYETSSNASALQWLNAQQTSDKKQPFLFSQCQAIHARSIVPCMDTPAVKHTYTAKVTVPNNVVALMSAVLDENATKETSAGFKTFTFSQKVPIASYLVAIVVGALEKRDLSKRCAVWAEPSVVDAAAWEFGETETMLQTAEQLLGPYEWGRYDLLVLPASFPFGGMENPCLSFITPTIIAGDRSLASVIAHELTHSWTGNLVTNATWEHFWLNEGWTVFVERKIVGKMDGEAMRDLEGHSGFEARLRSAIYEQFKPDHPFTKLVLDESPPRDPDDSFSSIPYEKGSAFLLHIEQKLGGAELFDPFIRAYVEKFKNKSITTDQWKEFLYEHFAHYKTILDSIDWEGWLYKPGMPPLRPKYDMSLAEACHNLCKKWLDADEEKTKNFDKTEYNQLSSLQKVDFLSKFLQDTASFPHYKLEKMLELYQLNETKNCEILFYWIRLCLKSKWQPIVPKAIEFVTNQGRMKYIRPVYRDLNGWEFSKMKAVENFGKNKASMHGLSASIVAKDLKLEM